MHLSHACTTFDPTEAPTCAPTSYWLVPSTDAFSTSCASCDALLNGAPTILISTVLLLGCWVLVAGAPPTGERRRCFGASTHASFMLVPHAPHASHDAASHGSSSSTPLAQESCTSCILCTTVAPTEAPIIAGAAPTGAFHL